jgi:DNA-binding Lrp family transcriptional regulator
MVRAFILIRSDAGSERELFENMSDLDEVIDADLTYGEWDIIVKVELEGDVTALKEFVLSKIRLLDGVKQTSTLIVAD